MREVTKESQELRNYFDELAQESYLSMGENVRKFRVLERLTQDGLAGKCLLSAAYISQIERADMYKGITYQSILQIAHALGVPSCVLVAREPCQRYIECLTKNMDKPFEPTKIGRETL